MPDKMKEVLVKEPAAQEPAVFGDEKAVRNGEAMAAVSLNDGLVAMSVPREDFARNIIEALREREYLACPPVGFKNCLQLGKIECPCVDRDFLAYCITVETCPKILPPYNSGGCLAVNPGFRVKIDLKDLKVLHDNGILTSEHLTPEVIKAFETIRG